MFSQSEVGVGEKERVCVCVDHHEGSVGMFHILRITCVLLLFLAQGSVAFLPTSQMGVRFSTRERIGVLGLSASQDGFKINAEQVYYVCAVILRSECRVCFELLRLRLFLSAGSLLVWDGAELRRQVREKASRQLLRPLHSI